MQNSISQAGTTANSSTNVDAALGQAQLAQNHMLGNVIDSKINQLLSLSDEFIFPTYYSHTDKVMWKISNVYTKYGSETFVLCGVEEGIEKAIDLAIEHISKAKEKFYGGDV